MKRMLCVLLFCIFLTGCMSAQAKKMKEDFLNLADLIITISKTQDNVPASGDVITVGESKSDTGATVAIPSEPVETNKLAPIIAIVLLLAYTALKVLKAKKSE